MLSGLVLQQIVIQQLRLSTVYNSYLLYSLACLRVGKCFAWEKCLCHITKGSEAIPRFTFHPVVGLRVESVLCFGLLPDEWESSANTECESRHNVSHTYAEKSSTSPITFSMMLKMACRL